MLRKSLFITLFVLAPLSLAFSQKKEMQQAKDNIKAGTSLEATEASMRTLLAGSVNRRNEKIWLLLFDAVRKQYETVNEQMFLKQATDTAKLFNNAYRMFGVLEGLDSIDAMPDSKGVVKLKYRKRHAEYLDRYRPNIFTGGLFFMQHQDFASAYRYFAAYADCASQPLFTSYQYDAKDRKMPLAGYYAVYCAYKAKMHDDVLKYADIALRDKYKMESVLHIMADTYLAKGDTASYVGVLERGFDAYPLSDYFFPLLFDIVNKKNGEKERALQLCDRVLMEDPDNITAMYAKSGVLLSCDRFDECVALCDRIIEADDTYADAYLNAGMAYYLPAAAIVSDYMVARTKKDYIADLLKKSLPYMETYRKLAPERKDKWANVLYMIYLSLNMGEQFEEMDAIVKGME